MKILAHIPFYVPTKHSGAETYIYTLFKHFIAKGHDCAVIVDRSEESEYEGVKIYIKNKINPQELYADYDVIVTQLGTAGQAIGICKRQGKKIFHIIHNTNRQDIHNEEDHIIAVYNAEWVKEELNYKHDSIICRPIVPMADYETDLIDDYVTLVGLNKNKGGVFLSQLAKLMPQTKFLAVMNAYGEQYTNFPDNVTIHEVTQDMKSVYAKTKILICPSIYESWSRVASEAMCSGIPVIYNTNPGLTENVSDAGIGVPREDLKGWVGAINEINESYEKWSDKAYSRALEQSSWNDFDNLLKKMENEVQSAVAV